MSRKYCWPKATSAFYSHRGNQSNCLHRQRTRQRRKFQSLRRHAVSRAAYSTSSSSNATTTKTDYWNDGGIIEGVWMFSRHGDRTPGRPLSPEHRRDEEAAFWLTKLPIPDSASVFERFEKYFPVHRARLSEDFIDAPRNPFGFLTSKGLLQLSANGRRFFQRYNNHAYHFPGHEKWRWESPHDFLSAWDFRVFSTNYLRTIMSIQSFLDGMFGTHCYDIPSTKSDRLYDPSLVKEARIPTVTDDRCKDADVLVKIMVRDTASDPLNAFDRNPDLIAGLVSEVMTTDDFVQRDGKAASLAARLANILPGLVRRKQGSDFSARAPSGINWVEAADHFICRTSHGLDFARFTDFEDDEGIIYTLQAMEHQTLAHLSWRFRKWYQHERLLAVIAAPPLREICDQIHKTPFLDTHQRRPFVIYSCHDITILGLLYGIGADFLAKGDEVIDIHHTSGNDIGTWRYWPPYGSNLAFELVRVREGLPGPDSHIVRIVLNGEPVRSSKIDIIGRNKQGTMDGLFFIEDFERVVSKLENDGGIDCASLLGGSEHFDPESGIEFERPTQ